MKIKARDIKPGMVIGFDRCGNGKYDDICLVVSTKGLEKVSYGHFDYMDGYSGKMYSYLEGETKVKVIKGKKRQKVIKKIKSDIHRLYWDVKNDIDLIWLIQSMEKSWE